MIQPQVPLMSERVQGSLSNTYKGKQIFLKKLWINWKSGVTETPLSDHKSNRRKTVMLDDPAQSAINVRQGTMFLIKHLQEQASFPLDKLDATKSRSGSDQSAWKDHFIASIQM